MQPKGEKTPFLNESQVPKLSYDYQAALGEYGQKRPSYGRLKRIHLFVRAWEDKLCRMKTFLPEHAEEIEPEDVDTLRFTVRFDGESGFVFLNNYQDHVETKAKEECAITVKLPEGEVKIDGISLAAGENAILPLNMDLDGIKLKYATAQPLTVFKEKDYVTYFFFTPDGLKPRYVFDAETVKHVDGVYNETDHSIEVLPAEGETDACLITGALATIRIVTLTAVQSMNFYEINRKGSQLAVLTEGTLLYDGNILRVESENEEEAVYFWPDAVCEGGDKKTAKSCGIFKGYQYSTEKKELSANVQQIGPVRYTIEVPENFMDGVKEVLLSIRYTGDIAHLFIDGDMIADDFCNGRPWETGLKLFENRLAADKITLRITPLKEGSHVNVESVMAGRKEEVDQLTADVHELILKPVYEYRLGHVEEA